LLISASRDIAKNVGLAERGLVDRRTVVDPDSATTPRADEGQG